MKNVLSVMMLCVPLLTGGAMVYASNTPPQKATDLAQSALVKLVADSVAEDYLQVLIDSERGKHLRAIQKTDPHYSDKAPESTHIDHTISIDSI